MIARRLPHSLARAFSTLAPTPQPETHRQLNLCNAVNEALHQAIDEFDRTSVFGEDVAFGYVRATHIPRLSSFLLSTPCHSSACVNNKHRGVFRCTVGLQQRFGRGRCVRVCVYVNYWYMHTLRSHPNACTFPWTQVFQHSFIRTSRCSSTKLCCVIATACLHHHFDAQLPMLMLSLPHKGIAGFAIGMCTMNWRAVPEIQVIKAARVGCCCALSVSRWSSTACLFPNQPFLLPPAVC